jgi:hypothetical protein
MSTFSNSRTAATCSKEAGKGLTDPTAGSGQGPSPSPHGPGFWAKPKVQTQNPQTRPGQARKSPSPQNKAPAQAEPAFYRPDQALTVCRKKLLSLKWESDKVVSTHLLSTESSTWQFLLHSTLSKVNIDIYDPRGSIFKAVEFLLLSMLSNLNIDIYGSRGSFFTFDAVKSEHRHLWFTWQFLLLLSRR